MAFSFFKKKNKDTDKKTNKEVFVADDADSIVTSEERVEEVAPEGWISLEQLLVVDQRPSFGPGTTAADQSITGGERCQKLPEHRPDRPEDECCDPRPVQTLFHHA